MSRIVAPLLHQPPPVLDRRAGVEEQPAVRERVGRDVDYAHDHRRLHRRSID
jgi:hypothetical protein